MQTLQTVWLFYENLKTINEDTDDTLDWDTSTSLQQTEAFSDPSDRMFLLDVWKLLSHFEYGFLIKYWLFRM